MYSTIIVKEDRRDLTYISSDENVATVSENGELVAKAVGTTTITIKNRYKSIYKDNDFERTCIVTVTDGSGISGGTENGPEDGQKPESDTDTGSSENNENNTETKTDGNTGNNSGTKPDGDTENNSGTKPDGDTENNSGTKPEGNTENNRDTNPKEDKKDSSASVKKGAIHTVKKLKYKILNVDTTGKGTVAVIGTTHSSKLTKLVIGNTVVIKGSKFNITSISTNAFKNCKKLKSVEIGVNIKSIGKAAFSGNKKLSQITIKSKKCTIVGKNAFKGIKSNAVIKVPVGKMKAYKKLLSKKAGIKKTMKWKRL